jgi:hypothetical protein
MKFQEFEGHFSLLETVEWLIRSGNCYRRNSNSTLNDSNNLDMDTLENLMFNFSKFYTESEI